MEDAWWWWCYVGSLWIFSFIQPIKFIDDDDENDDDAEDKWEGQEIFAMLKSQISTSKVVNLAIHIH